MPTSNPISPQQVAANVELGKHSQFLQAILAQLRTQVLQVAVGDTQQQELSLNNFPVAGAKRVIAQRNGAGYDFFSVPTTGALVLSVNEGRLGGQIVNSGANAVVLYLWANGAAGAGKPAIWLAPNGGSWDFRLGNLTWCGSVSAVAQTGASTLSVAEV